MWNFIYSRTVVLTNIVHPCLQGVIISLGIFWCPSTSFCFISCLMLSVFLYLSSTFSGKLTYQPGTECHIPTQDQQYLMTLEQQTKQPLSLPHWLHPPRTALPELQWQPVLLGHSVVDHCFKVHVSSLLVGVESESMCCLLPCSSQCCN